MAANLCPSKILYSFLLIILSSIPQSSSQSASPQNLETFFPPPLTPPASPSNPPQNQPVLPPPSPNQPGITAAAASTASTSNASKLTINIQEDSWSCCSRHNGSKYFGFIRATLLFIPSSASDLAYSLLFIASFNDR